MAIVPGEDRCSSAVLNYLKEGYVLSITLLGAQKLVIA